ncbi:hypothetical protein PoB_005354500 [Plakobranchus ocellatus]|uniref:Uncharacterized protein n=1 Tax=Plakobranchus ocellatus TaxID=259542 RepID=A0AAV4C2Y6_9GAST|nr:hypothetical protein PoB_005354500 [Plakobranchus ocellatus]
MRYHDDNNDEGSNNNKSSSSSSSSRRNNNNISNTNEEPVYNKVISRCQARAPVAARIRNRRAHIDLRFVISCATDAPVSNNMEKIVSRYHPKVLSVPYFVPKV